MAESNPHIKKGVSQKEKHDDNQMSKNVGQAEWLQRGSIGGSW